MASAKGGNYEPKPAKTHVERHAISTAAILRPPNGHFNFESRYLLNA